MRLAIALFVFGMLVTTAGVGLAAWTGHLGHHDTMRPIHYDTKYDLSSQRRIIHE